MATGKKLDAALREPRQAATDIRSGQTVAAIKQAFLDNLFNALGRHPMAATPNDLYMALALTVRDRVLRQGVATADAYLHTGARSVCYFSAEYLPGPHLDNNLLNLGIRQQVQQALAELDINLDELIAREEEPGLGNGGLGRLAACFMDSLATLHIPAMGYGIRYEFGIFDQEIKDGCQVEVTDKWLRFGNPWEIARPELAFEVKLGGHTQAWTDSEGRYRVNWVPARVVKGVAYDTPILGYQAGHCDWLRLWKAEAIESFDFAAFNHGDYYRAVEDKVVSENISKVLYPNDEPEQGKRLRLEQQYFFVTCSLQDLFRVHRMLRRSPETFHEKFAIQLNDTHPSIAVAELMRILVDEYLVDWDTAWNVTQHTFSYTNHTLLPEALEKWPLPLFASVLPRHLEIIYEINRRFLDDVRRLYPGDEDRVRRLSLIDETGERYVRMAHLAAVGSHTINGVARLHSELLKSQVMRDFAELWPQKFLNVTNGVTLRRFVGVSNPGLTALLTKRIGGRWLTDADELRQLEAYADDSKFQAEWREVKRANKVRLAALIHERTGVVVDPASLFDVQVKRIHEYKRQHLNVLHLISLWWRLRHDPKASIPPRTFIFGGKAAPGYFMAKRIIKFINSAAALINNDPAIDGRLKVVFFPDFNVKNAHFIYPAADLSEQISTAGKEASGTGNMKFALNGALTIGTLDGANIEIREAVGKDNFFLFGLTAEEIAPLQSRGYRPRSIYENNSLLREVLDFIAAGGLSGGDKELFRPIVDNLLYDDPFFVLADFAAYADAHEKVSRLWLSPDSWTRASILTVARMGWFSSDRAIREYCEHIWHVTPLPPSCAKPI